MEDLADTAHPPRAVVAQVLGRGKNHPAHAKGSGTNRAIDPGPG